MQALNDQPSDDEIVNIENASYLPDDIKYKFPTKKSYASLHSIQSPSTTYLHMEEEHRKLTEAQLTQNLTNDTENRAKLIPNFNDGNILSSESPTNKQDDIEHELMNEPSSIDLSQQNFMITDFKIGKGHDRKFSSNEMKGFTTIRNSLLRPKNTDIDNQRPKISSHSKPSIKRSSYLNHGSHTLDRSLDSPRSIEEYYRSTPRQTRQKSRSINNVNNNKFSANESIRSNHTTSFGSPESLKKTRENFEIRTLKNDIKQLHMENQLLKEKLSQASNHNSIFTESSNADNANKDIIEKLQNQLLDAEEMLSKNDSENASLVDRIYECEDYIESLEKKVDDYSTYTEDIIAVLNHEVASIKNRDQFQTLNERYKIKEYNEEKIRENFINIYNFITTLLTLFVDGNREKQFIQDELLHDMHDSDAPSLNDNKALLESNQEMRDMIFNLKNSIENLSLKNSENEKSLTNTTNVTENKSSMLSDNVPKEKLDQLDARVSHIYNELIKTNNENLKNLKLELNEKSKEVSKLMDIKEKLHKNLHENDQYIAIQNEKIMKLKDHAEFFSIKHYKVVTGLYDSCEYFLKELFLEIQTGDHDSLKKPIRKLEKVKYLIQRDFESNINTIHGNLFALIKFIEESVQVLISKFNDDILIKNKAINYKIQKGLEKKWTNESNFSHEDRGTSRSINAKKL